MASNDKRRDKRHSQRARAVAAARAEKERAEGEAIAAKFHRRAALRTEYHISLSLEALRTATEDPAYVDLMRLCKLANSLLFMIEATVNRDLGDDSVSVRRMESGGLLIAGIAREALIVAKEVVDLGRWPLESQKLRSLLDHTVVATACGKDGYLSRARDKTAFHADKVVMREGLARITQRQIPVEHVTGWNGLNVHYPSADLAAYLYLLAGTLPTDEDLADFRQLVGSTLQPLQATATEDDTEGAIRRAVELTIQVSRAICDAVGDLATVVNKRVGGEVLVGPPQPPASSREATDQVLPSKLLTRPE